MLNSHEAQKQASLEASFARAGIQRGYRHLSLKNSEHPLAPRCLEWVNGASAEAPERGMTFVGSSNEIRDLAILTARALHVTGRAVRMMTLVGFFELLQNERAILASLMDEAQTFVLLDLGPLFESAADESYSRRDLRILEYRLASILDDQRRLLLHTTSRDFGAWMPARFVQRVAKLNETMRDVL